MSRLGHILSGGKHIAKVVMLYPINSIWTNYVPQSRNDIGNVIEFDFNYLTDTLLKLHFDFDYVDEDILSEGKVENGKLKIAEEEFELLILPPLTHIKASAFEKIHEFVNSGGKVIADTLIPTSLLEYEQDDEHKKITDLFGKDPKGLLYNFGNGATFGITHKNGNGDVYVIEGKGLNRERKKEKLNEIILKCIKPDVTISNEDIFYLHRQKDGYDIYFITNVLQEDKGEVEITFEKIGVPEIWNANTGSIEKLNIYRVKDGRLSIKLNFPPSESHIIIIRDENPSLFISESNIQIESFDGNVINGFGNPSGNEVYLSVSKDDELVKLNSPAKSELPELKLGRKYKFCVQDDNVLCIPNWKMKTIENSDTDLKYTEINYDDSDWLHITLGAWEMQLPQERDEEIYPVTLWYRTSFEAEKLVKNMRLLIDGFSGSEYKLFINGKDVKDKGHRSKLDAEIKEIDIDDYLVEGKNIVAVRLVVTRRTDGILDLLKVVGDFALKNKNNQYIITEKKNEIAIGDWTKHGYPFFSGTGVYETSFELPEEYLNGKVFLRLNCGEDVAEVIVNNSTPIVIPWNPYDIDITNFVKAGANVIEIKITNTLINILEGVQKESGLFDEPVIKHFNNYKITL
jgi:hypothetical protein